jgi:hypothetical protein
VVKNPLARADAEKSTLGDLKMDISPSPILFSSEVLVLEQE